jgi:hypothetical protein
MRPAPVPCLPAWQVFGGGDEQRAFDDRTQHKLGQHFDRLGRQQARPGLRDGRYVSGTSRRALRAGRRASMTCTPRQRVHERLNAGVVGPAEVRRGWLVAPEPVRRRGAQWVTKCVTTSLDVGGRRWTSTHKLGLRFIPEVAVDLRSTRGRVKIAGCARDDAVRSVVPGEPVLKSGRGNCSARS